MNKQHERKQNLFRVVEALQLGGPMTQSELKSCCALQASTVSYLVNDLRSFNLICEHEGLPAGEKKVGKPGVVIGLDNSAACFLGIYLIDDAIEMSIYGLDGRMIECERHPIEDDSMLEDTLISCISIQLKNHPQVRKVGIAVKGIIHNDGRLESGNRYPSPGRQTHWNFLSFVDNIRKGFPGYEVIVENDANCAALCYQFEDRLGDETSVTYVLNTRPFGIGLGLMVNGQLFRGSDGCAGEYYEDGSFLKDERDLSADKLEDTLGRLSNHMKMVCYLMNPARLIICGSALCDADSHLAERLKNILSSLPCDVEVKTEAHFNAPARGAALKAIDSFVREIIGGIERRW